VNRWRALFAAAVLLTLVVGHLLRDTPGYVVRQDDGSLAGDITHYVYWTRLVTLGGIQSAYSGTWPETYAVYPPLTLLPYEALGTLYQHFEDPGFDADRAQQSLWLHEGIKLVALVWHLLTGAALFLLLRRLSGEPLAAIAASLYLLDPATLYDVAHWAQPDGAHAVFSVLAVGLLSSAGALADTRGVLAAWASMALAALAKPQAWFMVPLLAFATARAFGAAALMRGLAAGAAVALLISLPFIVSGHLLELLTLPLQVSKVMPVVSADAHNLWWLVLQLRGQNPIFLFDSERAFGPLTYRTLSGGLVLAVMLLTCWLFATRRTSLPEASALGVLGWFVFTTQAHENHLFFALPLLSLAWPGQRWLLAPFGVVSLTLLLNMVLHDQLVVEALGHSADDPLLDRLRLANAALNVTCFVGWSAWAVLRKPAATWATVNLWPRYPIRVGLEARSD
jgi:hypothetical protein